MESSSPDSQHHQAARAPTFACARCHRVRFFTRVRVAEAWNQLIAYLTAGLLYGREVPRPPWFTAQRKKPYKPRPGAPPARRRAQVRDRLLRGDAIATIAAALHVTPAAVTQHAVRIYRAERVRGQRALLAKYDKPLPSRLIPRRDAIAAALRAGHPPARIAADFSIRITSVERYVRDLRRLGHLPPRPTRRAAVAAHHAAGLTRPQIAATLAMTPQSVSTRLHELRRAGQLPPPARRTAKPSTADPRCIP